MRYTPKTVVTLIGSAVFLFVTGGAVAQNLTRGVEFLDAGFYETAKINFLNEIKQNPSARAYYHLGDAYLKLKNLDSASFYYQKSAESDPEFQLAQIGMGKVKLHSGDKAGAASIFAETTKSKASRKNPELFTSIASVYYSNGMYAEAKNMVTAALTAKKNYPEAFIIEGDILFKEKDHNAALGKYAQATYFDKENKGAKLRTAQAYIGVNRNMSMEILDQLIQSDPNYYPAYAELADYYYSAGNFANAIEPLSKLAYAPGMPDAYLQNYAAALYFTQQYDQSLKAVEDILAKDPNNFVTRRIRMYNNFEKKENELAYEQAQEFFSNKSAEDAYIGLDYLVYGRLQESQNENQAAIESYTKAIELDDTQAGLRKNIIDLYDKMNNYPKAVEMIKEYLINNGKADAVDFFNFGRTYYHAANQVAKSNDTDATNATRELFMQSSEMFDSTIFHNPEHHLGYLWKARALASIDPKIEEGLAKPVYEELLNVIMKQSSEGRDERKRELLETYRYLGNFYHLRGDKTTAIEYFNRLLEVDPNNEQIKAAIKHLMAQ